MNWLCGLVFVDRSPGCAHLPPRRSSGCPCALRSLSWATGPQGGGRWDPAHVISWRRSLLRRSSPFFSWLLMTTRIILASQRPRALRLRSPPGVANRRLWRRKGKKGGGAGDYPLRLNFDPCPPPRGSSPALLDAGSAWNPRWAPGSIHSGYGYLVRTRKSGRPDARLFFLLRKQGRPMASRHVPHQHLTVQLSSAVLPPCWSFGFRSPLIRIIDLPLPPFPLSLVGCLALQWLRSGSECCTRSSRLSSLGSGLVVWTGFWGSEFGMMPPVPGGDGGSSFDGNVTAAGGSSRRSTSLLSPNLLLDLGSIEISGN